MSEVRGRFAPSPTGDLHIGNARTALLAWLQARSAGGRFVLRMEDLDPGRVRPEFLQSQLLDLRWLGLDWDEGPDVGGPVGPYLQTQRAELYDEALEKLWRAGYLYQCHCTRKEIAAAVNAPHAADDAEPPYPGTCRPVPLAESPLDSPNTAVRFRVPEEEVAFIDRVHGQQRLNPSRVGGDFVVRRKDGVAAYQLAAVVDDAAMGITDVLRGADLLTSTPRQILLYKALGLSMPRWAHVPLILGEDGERLAKRSGALTLRELREVGADAKRLVGWLAWSCGLNPDPGAVSAAELVDRFSLDDVSKADAIVCLPEWLMRK